MGNTRKAAVRRLAPARPVQTDRVCVAFIHPGQCSAYFTTSLVGALLYDQASHRHIVALINEWSSANVSAARNTLTRVFLEEKTDADWLLWVDADMAFDPDALHRLLEVADPDTAPIVGGLCFGNNATTGLFPTIYQLIPTDDGGPTTVRVNDFPPDTLHPCSATGAAFLLIHRSVVQAIKDKGFNKAFPWFQEAELNGQPCGEDITFCLRAFQLGIPTHVHTGVKIGHHKSQLLTDELFQEQKEAACPTAATA